MTRPTTPVRPAARWPVAFALALSLVVAATAAVVPGAPRVVGALPAPTPGALARDASRWLAEEHRWHTDAFTNPRVASDALVAWAATGTEHAAAMQVKDWMVAAAPTFADPQQTLWNLDNLSRAVLALSIYGVDPGDVGGHDLEDDLRSLMVTDGPAAGRFRDDRTERDPSDRVRPHVLAALALAATDDGVPPALLAQIEAAQCTDGPTPGAVVGAFDPTRCHPADPGDLTRATVDVEATAYAIQAFDALGRTGRADAAGAWLASIQQPAGHFARGLSSAGLGAGEVGIAAQSLWLVGEDVAADRAVGYLSALQLTGTHGVPTHDVGAIGAAPNRLDDAVAAGRIPLDRRIDMWRDHTPRAVLGLAGTPLLDLVPPPPAPEGPAPTRWTARACAPAQGVTVLVDLRPFEDRAVTRCALGSQVSGWSALVNAGFALTSTPGGPGTALCTIDGVPAPDAVAPARPDLAGCAGPNGWTSWHAPAVGDAPRWQEHGQHPSGDVPPVGSVEAWRFAAPRAQGPTGMAFAALAVLVTSGPDHVTPDTPASFAFTVTGGPTTVECQVTAFGATARADRWAPCATGSSHTATGQGPGRHTLVVRVSDGVGMAEAQRSWAVGELTDPEPPPPPGTRPADESWLVAAFTDLVGRPPTDRELSTALARLASGTARHVLARELTSGDSWLTVVVTRFYTDTLGRRPDAAGLRFWVGELRSGRRSVAHVASSFYASPEYFRAIGGGTARTWVADLYRKLLGREPDPAGLDFWVGFTAERGHARLAATFYATPESLRARVFGLYDVLLDRHPDLVDAEFWSDVVRRSGDLDLAVHLVVSAEYGHRAVRRFP